MPQGIREFESHTFRQCLGPSSVRKSLDSFVMRSRTAWLLGLVLVVALPLGAGSASCGAAEANLAPALTAPAAMAPATSASAAITPTGEAASDLTTLLQHAIERHPSIATRRQEMAAARGALDGAKWQRFPSVSLQGSLLSTNNSLPATLSVQQVLWAGGRVESGIVAADRRMLAANAAILAEEQTLLERTVIAYAELQRQQARLEASQENVRRHEDLYALIARRVGQEVSSAADSALALARLAQARAERQQILGAMGSARAALQALSGDPVRTVVAFDAPALGFDSISAALAAAEQFSPEILKQRSLADAAAADLLVRQGQVMPTLAARFEHLRNPIIGIRSSTERALLAFEFQPGAGLSALSAVQEAEARRLAALAAVEGARLDLEQKINLAWVDAQASVIQREPLRLLARTNAAIVDSFLRQYRVGRKSWLDVMNAQREAVQARYSLADIDAQALSGALRLQVVGGLIAGDSLAGLSLVPLPALAPPAPLSDALAEPKVVAPNPMAPPPMDERPPTPAQKGKR